MSVVLNPFTGKFDFARSNDEEVRASIALYKLQKNSAIDKKIQELQHKR